VIGLVGGTGDFGQGLARQQATVEDHAFDLLLDQRRERLVFQNFQSVGECHGEVIVLLEDGVSRFI